ncbi:MAG TPA: mechanosensitive ion channel domain-containing protein, partial [Terriglobales bacterium]|nr:mechanosensitive ion channel domain-containing protein [Terriglobales bacterium]
MKPRQRLTLTVLLLLLAGALAGVLLTRDAGTPARARRSKRIRARDLVDQRPLETARRLALLPAEREERPFLRRALRVGDDAVDLAFQGALLEATAHPAPASDELRELHQHIKDAQARIVEDQTQIERLQRQLQSKNPADAQQQLDIAQAQLALDQEELADAKQDLGRAGGDLENSIKRLLDEHGTTHNTIATMEIPLAPEESWTLLSHLKKWRALQDKQGQLQAAEQETTEAVTALSAQHDALEASVKAAKASGLGPKSGEAVAKTVAAMRQLSEDTKALAAYDQRIQSEQELTTIYRDWQAVVAARQRQSVHGMLQSAAWIVLICLGAFVANLLISRFDATLTPDRRRLRTLHLVTRFAIRAVAFLLIAIVVLGAPGQMTTVIGLAGAGLTVALKDFIVAFFGWFVLMGRNGIRVGDWVEIKGIGGEVVEIGLLRTVLLETGKWSDSGHPTGRKVAFVNSFAIEGHYFNFSTTGQWLWDELEILVPPDQDPYPIAKAIEEMATKETEANARLAEQEWQRVVSSHALQSFSAAPAVDLRPTNIGVSILVRYITRAHERYELRSRLYAAVVELLRKRNIP